ncbi:hypothetical protein THIOSC15_1310006 [uncultured Thiomicrorhabdus sp.]
MTFSNIHSPNTGILFDNCFAFDNYAGGDGLYIEQNNDGAIIRNFTTGNNGLSGVKVEPNPSNPVTNTEIIDSYSFDNVALGYYYNVAQVPVFTDNTALNNGSGGDIDAAYAPDTSLRLLDPVKVSGHERGATILNRYVDGVQTSTPLWPYPNEDVIKEHMCNQSDLEDLHRWSDTDPMYVGIPAWCATDKTLTAYIWELDGATCPTDICPPQFHSLGSLP